MKKEITNLEIQEVIGKLNIALNDESYRMGWVSNIAMAYIDNERWYREANGKVGKYLNKQDKHNIANMAAEYFLMQLSK